jgi:hypothetical protein
MNRRTAVLLAVLTIALILGFQLGTPKITQAVTAASIDTTPSWNGVQFISSFGAPNTATYGQTITVPADTTTTLTKFSFFLEAPTSAIFRGFVSQWDGSKAVGTLLYESAPISTTQSAPFEEIVFNISGGLKLNAGQQYVLFASTSKDPVQPASSGRWGSTNNTAYSGGQFVFLNNGTDPSQWTSTAWSTIAQDLAFRASFVGHLFLPLIRR